MISPLESRILDANSECLGVSVRELMDSAGQALAEFLDDTVSGRILFVCGSGNNGGDGYVAYRHLSERADVCAFREPKSKLCTEVSKDIETIDFGSVCLNKYEAIVDCVLGTGVEGKLRPEYEEYVRWVNSSGKKIVSCDVPTGFGTDFMVKPDATVTFHDVKEGMNEDNCGTIVVCDIRIPEEASSIVGKGDFLRYPVPSKNSHKGQNGKLLIVGGGPYVGAPVMAALSALRVGVDLVKIFTPKSSFLAIASFSPSYVVKQLSENVLCDGDVDFILEECSKSDALLIGPGLGTDPSTIEAVRRIVEKTDVPTVIDADAITCISDRVPTGKNMVFTPHKMELKRLVGEKSNSPEEISSFCDGKGCVILSKGPIDNIYGPGKHRRNTTGSPGMTVGGTGDVLAGAVAGLVSKGMNGFDAACLAAYICGLAGERSFDKNSYGMTATDVIDNIGPVLRDGLK